MYHLASQKFKLIVAIDFGTSLTKLAFTYVYTIRESMQNQIEIFQRWPTVRLEKEKLSVRQTEKSRFVPTTLLYEKDANKPAWGYIALNEHLKRLDEENQKKVDYFNGFKMALYEKKEEVQAIGGTGRKFKVVNLISDYLSEITKHFLNHFDPPYKYKDVFFCLTVPTIWKDRQKDLMLEAAIQAGLIENAGELNEKLFFVLESEAASLAFFRSGSQIRRNINEGDTYIILDVGGGTADITAHKVKKDKGKKLKLEAIKDIASGGGPFGSTYLDEEFELFLEKIFTREVIITIRQKYPIEFFHLLNLWIEEKNRYEEGALKFRIPEFRSDVLEKVNIETKSISAAAHLLEVRGTNRRIELTEEEFRDFHFNQRWCKHSTNSPEKHQGILPGIASELDELLHRLRTKGETPRYIILAGGFSRSAIMQNFLRDRYKDSQLQVFIDNTAETAVVWGAVNFGIEPEIIITRVSKVTYGIGAVREYTDTDRQNKKTKITVEGKDYCDSLSIFVKRGELVDWDYEVVSVYEPLTREQTSFEFCIYASSKLLEPEYPDDSGVTLIDKFTIDNIPRCTKKKDTRKIFVTMSFLGRIGVRAICKEYESQEFASEALSELYEAIQYDKFFSDFGTGSLRLKEIIKKLFCSRKANCTVNLDASYYSDNNDEWERAIIDG